MKKIDFFKVVLVLYFLSIFLIAVVMKYQHDHICFKIETELFPGHECRVITLFSYSDLLGGWKTKILGVGAMVRYLAYVETDIGKWYAYLDKDLKPLGFVKQVQYKQFRPSFMNIFDSRVVKEL
jgi:hypothetical protein